jgi:hypothetical protein
MAHDASAAPRTRGKNKVGCHPFRPTGITEYLRNGGKLEIPQQMGTTTAPAQRALYDA